MHDVLNIRDILADELVQRGEEGYDVVVLEEPVQNALANGSDADCQQLLDRLEKAERRADWLYKEPSTLEEIKASLLPAPPLPNLDLGEEELADRLHAAWLGRCAGCSLGKPVEGWSRDAIRNYLELANAYPLEDYFPALDPMPAGFQLNSSWPETTRGRMHFMARDDDIDYTMLNLHLLETRGFDFGPEDVGQKWMAMMPFLKTYTAERAAYRNLVYGLRPPETALHSNPYREWIGAQIRADMWGYVSPGDPARAAWLAFQDASLSHTKNGIYGAMWAAALIAASFVAPTMRAALAAALAQVPPHSRLAEALDDVLGLYSSGIDWESARNDLAERYYGQYSFIHTVNNAAVVAAALLWGEGDYTRTIGLAVQGGWDTDCNGATAGSVFGAMHGTKALPAKWIDPLNDVVRSAVFGFDNSRISTLAERTLKLALLRLPC
jgi:ADP-ribosylglycohydrolase